VHKPITKSSQWNDKMLRNATWHQRFTNQQTPHTHLCIRWTAVEQHVKKRVIGELAQLADAV